MIPLVCSPLRSCPPQGKVDRLLARFFADLLLHTTPTRLAFYLEVFELVFGGLEDLDPRFLDLGRNFQGRIVIQGHGIVLIKPLSGIPEGGFDISAAYPTDPS